MNTPPLPPLKGTKWEALKALKAKVGKAEFDKFIDRVYEQQPGYGPFQAAVKISRETRTRYGHGRITEIINIDYPNREDFPL